MLGRNNTVTFHTHATMISNNAEFENIFMNKKQVILKKMWISM